LVRQSHDLKGIFNGLLHVTGGEQAGAYEAETGIDGGQR
jgi:hypothetical protein